MATAVLIPVEEYLANIYEPDCDYLDGRLEERNVGEWDHANVQTEIAFWFRLHAADWEIRAATQCRICMGVQRYRIPDVLVMRLQQPREPVLTSPPLLVVEVMSSCDTLRSLAPRLRDYAAFGIENIWILDPSTRKGYAWFNDAVHEAADLRVAGSGIFLPLPDIFSALDN